MGDDKGQTMLTTHLSPREKEELLRQAIRRYLRGEIDRQRLDEAQEKYKPDHRSLVDSQAERRKTEARSR
jgi:hypothetical protein